MDRAARAVRRSGVKLMSFGAGHTELNLLIMELTDLQKTAKALVKVQNSVANTQSKWALMESSPAIRDVASQIEELSHFWSQMQREFLEEVREVRRSYEVILESERRVDNARHALCAIEQREVRMRKEVKKAAEKRRVSPDEMRQLESRLLDAEALRHSTQMDLADKSLVNENLKLTQFKKGMVTLSDAYLNFAANMTIVFESQKTVVKQLPDTNPTNINEIKYTGRGITKQAVEKARTRLTNYQHLREFSVQSGTSVTSATSASHWQVPSVTDMTAAGTLNTMDRLVEGAPIPQTRPQSTALAGCHRNNDSPPPPYTAVNPDLYPSSLSHHHRRSRVSNSEVVGRRQELQNAYYNASMPVYSGVVDDVVGGAVGMDRLRIAARSSPHSNSDEDSDSSISALGARSRVV